MADSEELSGFAPYRSLFSSYPLLRSRSSPHFFDADSPVEAIPTARLPLSSDASVLSSVPLSSLKAAAVNRWLSDPSRRICQYEIPGGGECRDPNCEDIHPSRASALEPTGTPFFHFLSLLTSLSSAIPLYSPFNCYQFPADADTARCLFTALPKGSEVTLEQLQTALEDFRRQQLDYDVRVRQALASLGLRLAS
jgi:hypothetical protein